MATSSREAAVHFRLLPSRDKAHRSILVIDDQPDTRTGVVKALPAGNNVVGTKNVVNALALLSTSRVKFDMVILACTVPDRSPRLACVKLVRTIFRRWPWIPVIVINGEQNSERLVADLLLSGARDFVRKPFTAPDLTAVVTRVVRRVDARSPAAPGAIATMKRVLASLGASTGDIPPLDHLAEGAAMSRSHFSRIFHAVAGMPLRDYTRDFRLKRAVELLLGSALSLTTIAVEANFYDLPHFDKAFRHRLGMSPQEFRRRHAPTPRGRGV